MLRYASLCSNRSGPLVRSSLPSLRRPPLIRPLHKIVVLDGWFTAYPRFDFDYRIELHNSTRPDQLPSRLQDATIAIATTTRITRHGLLAAKRLQLVSLNGTGVDSVDIPTLQELGIALCNLPIQATQSVAEHAIAQYYALRRSLMGLHKLAIEGQAWAGYNGVQARLQPFGSPPRNTDEETMVVIGYGALGRRIETLGRALGMRVLIAERKGAFQVRPGRVHFQQSLKQGTVFMLATPLTNETREMIGSHELAAMDPTSILINVGRGGVVAESALVTALRQGQIAGAAADVFKEEPATKANSLLLDPSIPNLLLSPHVAWYTRRTIDNTHNAQKANLDGFVSGKMINVVVPPGRRRRRQDMVVGGTKRAVEEGSEDDTSVSDVAVCKTSDTAV